MRVISQQNFQRHTNKNFYFDNNQNENDQAKKKIESIYNSIYEDNFFLILTISKASFLNRIDSKGKEIIEMIFNQDSNNINTIKKINLDISSRYNEDYAIIYQTYQNIKNKIGNYNYLTNFRKHCEKTEDYAYHSCLNNKLQKFFEIRGNRNEIKYVLCPDCKYCFLPNCIRMVCKNCNKEYFSSIMPPGQDKNVLLATWEKYHCGSMKNQTMKCIKCRRDLYINLNSNLLVCLNKNCNFTSKPLSILWKCSKCGKDFRSKPKIFNPTEMEIIQKAINLTLLIKKKAYPKELPCCHKNPEKYNFYHKEECKGLLYMGFLLDREIIVCDNCHAMNFEEKFTWICPKCEIKFHLHQLTSIKPFKARRYIINRDHSLISKRNNKSNINLRNMKENLNNKNFYNNFYQSIQPDDISSLLNKNNENFEKSQNFNSNEKEKKIFSDNDRSCSNEGKYRNYRRLSTINNEEEKIKNGQLAYNYNSHDASLARKKLHFYKKKNGKHYKTLLDVLEKKKDKESIVKSGRHLTNSDFSFNDLNSNNNYDISSTGASNKDGLTYNKTSRNNGINIKIKSDSKWRQISEMNDINEEENFVYQKKTNIPSYKKTIDNDNNCRLNDYKSQVTLLKDRQKNRNISDININLNLNRYDEDNKASQIFNLKNNSITMNSYVFDNESLSKKSINLNSNKPRRDSKNIRLNNSSVNIIENRIYRSNKRNYKKNSINSNINNSNVNSLNSELRSTNRNNKILNDDFNSNKLKVSEYNRKYRRYNRTKDDKENNNSKDKNYIDINNENEENERENQKKNENRNCLIYHNRKNYILKFNLRQAALGKNDKHENNEINKKAFNFKTNDKPIKVSRIYNNKILPKNSEKKKNINEDKESEINFERGEKKYQNYKDLKQQLKIKKSHDNFSMNNIIATPKKINEIQQKCIIPDFDEKDYKYLRPIGEGSYGMIFLVKNIKTNKEYALKKIICKNINEILKHKKQLELIYSMNHENIMKIYNLQIKYLDLTTYSLYIIMERAIGDWSLDIRKRILTKKFYKEIEIVSILKQVVGALLYLEDRKIAHRDVKPQNILIFPGKIYKVADLGEAKNIENINKEITLRGSELYMSPLVYKYHKLNKRNLIHNAFKSDVFSLGYSTLYAICLNLDVIEDIREMNDMEEIVNNIDKYFKKDLYSNKLYKLIINMIEIDENKRYSFRQIYREIKYW